VTSDVDDASLLLVAQGGDIEAFAEIVRRYEHKVRPVVRRMLDDPRDVEEAVQDVFVQAWRNLHRYRGDAAVFTWLYRIGVNESLGRLRRKRLVTVDLESPAALGAHESRVDVQPTLSAESSDTRSRVHAALATLPFEHREAVVLRDLVGLSNEEVADALGLSLAAAKSRIHRGRMSLRELLEPELGE
jgi:RNA polymerase sigma-70 factor (ECF subfamily)